MRRFGFAVLVAMLLPGGVFGAASTAPPDDSSHACVMIESTRRMHDGAEASGTGTGFLIDKDLVLTCNHLLHIPTPYGVVEAQRVRVQVGPGKFVNARVEQRNPVTDLAILKLENPVDASIRPLHISQWNLGRRAPLHIIGNFPDQLRTTRGNLLTANRGQGFAVASAKVYSGFSGGPILDNEGVVHGILSQRDDNHNAIFVRSDVVLDFLQQYARLQDRDIACFHPTVPAPLLAVETEVADLASQDGSANATPASAIRAAAGDTSDDEVVVALPMRPASGTYVSKNTTKKH